MALILLAEDNEVTAEIMRVRLENAADEIANCHLFDYVVVNEDLDRVIEDIAAIVVAERHRDLRLDLAVNGEPAVEAALRRRTPDQ